MFLMIVTWPAGAEPSARRPFPRVVCMCIYITFSRALIVTPPVGIVIIKLMCVIL